VEKAPKMGQSPRRGMKTHEFWREAGTRAIWAVELRDGIVVGGRGPLKPDEVAVDYLSGYDYATAKAADLEARREEFEPLDEEALLLLHAASD
jgi:hypothetical protein